MNNLSYHDLVTALKWFDKHSVNVLRGELEMTDVSQVANEALQVAEQVAPNAPAVEAAAAVAQTIANPGVSVLVEDLMLVHQLVTDVKAKLAGKPYTLTSIFNTLFWG